MLNETLCPETWFAFLFTHFCLRPYHYCAPFHLVLNFWNYLPIVFIQFLINYVIPIILSIITFSDLADQYFLLCSIHKSIWLISTHPVDIPGYVKTSVLETPPLHCYLKWIKSQKKLNPIFTEHKPQFFYFISLPCTLGAAEWSTKAYTSYLNTVLSVCGSTVFMSGRRWWHIDGPYPIP